MVEPKEYRIRVGKLLFKQPYYIVEIEKNNGKHIGYAEKLGSIFEPLAWKTRVSATRNMNRIKDQYPSAEVEIHYLN